MSERRLIGAGKSIWTSERLKVSAGSEAPKIQSHAVVSASSSSYTFSTTSPKPTGTAPVSRTPFPRNVQSQRAPSTIAIA